MGTEFRGKMSTLSCTVIRRRKPNGEQGNNMGDNEPKKKKKKTLSLQDSAIHLLFNERSGMCCRQKLMDDFRIVTHCNNYGFATVLTQCFSFIAPFRTAYV